MSTRRHRRGCDGLNFRRRHHNPSRKAALKPKEPSVIVLLPEDEAPELATKASMFAAGYQADRGTNKLRSDW
jgi:hypothetical protein